MGKFDDLQLPEKEIKCSFAKLMAALDDQDKAILQNALDDNRWTNRLLYEELQKRGFKCSRETLTAHRQARCKCLKD